MTYLIGSSLGKDNNLLGKHPALHLTGGEATKQLCREGPLLMRGRNSSSWLQAMSLANFGAVIIPSFGGRISYEWRPYSVR